MKQRIKLGVNVDHVATLRQARGGNEPDPVTAALQAELAGADGITIHLREDRRHIQERDLKIMREMVTTRLNLEMAATDEIITLAQHIKPDMCTLVPEKREELTTEGGLDVAGNLEVIRHAVDELAPHGTIVSLFIDPDERQLEATLKVQAPYVEIHTGCYANADGEDSVYKELQLIASFAKDCKEKGIRVNAGHGLDYQNVTSISCIPEIEELNIGHSIISRAVYAGIENAVLEMKHLMEEARRSLI